jgi:hypothetical protein
MPRSRGPRHQLARRLIVAASCLALAACSPAQPSSTTAVLHLENRLGNAVAVAVTPDDGAEDDTALRPCGGAVDLAVGRGIPAAGHWVIWLLVDPSGQFDANLAAWSGDPHDMPGQFNGTIIWSSGDIGQASLPQWLTVTPDGVTLGAAPPAGPVASPCGTWQLGTEPPPS